MSSKAKSISWDSPFKGPEEIKQCKCTYKGASIHGFYFKRFVKIWFLCHSFLYLLFLTIIHTVLYNNTYIHPSSFARGMSSCILIAWGSGCFYLASRDFFQEKQSYLLTESPLAKHEGGEGTTPFTPLPYRVERDFHTIHFFKLCQWCFMLIYACLCLFILIYLYLMINCAIEHLGLGR